MAPDASSEDTLGNSLIPIVNKLQDIFAQVRQGPNGPPLCKSHSRVEIQISF